MFENNHQQKSSGLRASARKWWPHFSIPLEEQKRDTTNKYTDRRSLKRSKKSDQRQGQFFFIITVSENIILRAIILRAIYIESFKNKKKVLKENMMQLVGHPLYSPDLAPCDLYLFPNVKESLRGTKFTSINFALKFFIIFLEEISLNE